MRRHFPFAVALLLGSALTQAAEGSSSRVARTRVAMTVPPTAYQLTSYVNRDSGQLLVHLQPKDSRLPDMVIDARTGEGRSQMGDELRRDFVRLGLETVAQVATGQAFDLQMLRQLGCSAPFHACTTPADADVLLFVGLSPAGNLLLDVVDIRPIFQQLLSWLSGQASISDGKFAASDLALLKLAARQPQRREGWLDAIRSINAVERWQNAYAAYSDGPKLGDFEPFRELPLQAVLQGATDDRVALGAELELVGLRLRAADLVEDWERSASADSLASLVELISFAGNEKGVQGRATGHVVGVLIDRTESRRHRLTEVLATQAIHHKSRLLWCNAEWVAGRDCGRPPPWTKVASRSLPPTEVGTSGRRAAAPIPPRNTTTAREEFATAGVYGISAKVSVGGGARVAGDAPQEWSLIQSLPNKLVLLSFSEATGRLDRESGQLEGFSFVARSLGNLSEGRFELQIIPSGRAPLRLAHGAYRVRVSLVLDHTREDQCSFGLSCVFKTSERYAKTERRTVTFRVAAGNQFRDNQACNFGHLLPLVADGGDRYRSVLREARLSIEGARFELL